MALAWQSIDLSEDPSEARYCGNPADVVDAYAELLELLRRPAWHERAACRGKGSGAWFPGQGVDVRPAQAICNGCPVAAECLAAGFREPAGIWGGASERARRQLRRGVAA